MIDVIAAVADDLRVHDAEPEVARPAATLPTPILAATMASTLALAACSGGGAGSTGPIAGGGTPTPAPTPTPRCSPTR